MRTLFRDTLIYGLSTVLSRGLSLLVLPIYTRVLSPAEYGALDMITVAGSLATLIVPLEVSQALARLYGEGASDQTRRTMSSTAMWFTLSAFGFMLLLSLIGARPLSELLLGNNMETPFRIGAGFIAASGIFYLIQNQLRVELRSRTYALISLLYATTTVALGVLLAYLLGFGLHGVLWAQLIAALVATLVGLHLLRDSIGLHFSGRQLKEMLRFSMPLVPSGLATFLTLYANRLLLNSMASLEAVGMFGIAARIAAVSGLLIVGLQSALTPLIYAHYQEPETPPRLARIFEGFAAIALLLCLGLGQFARELLLILADPSYAAAASLVMALAPAALLGQMYIFFPGIAIARRMHLQLVIFAITGAANLLLNLLLIQAFGLAGAAIATFLGGLLFLAIWVLVSQRLYALPIRWGAISLCFVLFVFTALASVVLLQNGMAPALSYSVRLGLFLLLGAAILQSGLVRISDLRRLRPRIGN